MILRDPALRWLARRKLQATLRRQLRRLRTARGALLGLLGAALIFWWLVPLAFVDRAAPSPASFAANVRFTLAVLTFSALASAVSHRGLYLPKEEIELLFSAPLARADVVRYRMLASIGRSLQGALVIALIAGSRAPVPAFGFAGALTATLTLPILAQAVSLAFGGAENRLARRLAKLPWRGLQLALVLALVVGFGQLALSARAGAPLDPRGAASWIEAATRHPIARVLCTPLEPWVRAIAAETWHAFVPAWLGSLAVAALLHELAARMRIDYRELSLETSADVARRIERLRSGQTQTAASRGKLTGFDLPWILGRGAFGALAWRKSIGIARKARGAAAAAVVIVAATVVLSIVLAGGGEDHALAGSAIVAAAGTIYVAAGMRFDFREDLASMAIVKSWPVAPWKIFLATLVPETALVSVLVVAGIAARAAFTGGADAGVAAVAAAVPLAAFTWIAIDNAAFLFAPVRVVAGQDGPLQNAGRALLLMLMRAVVFVGVGALAWLAFGAAQLARGALGYSMATGRAIGAALALATLAGCAWALVWVGGSLLRRFDPARDRG